MKTHFKRLLVTVLFGCTILNPLYGWNFSCPYGCDDLSASAGSILLDSLEKIDFLKGEMSFWGEVESHSYQNSFYFENREINWSADFESELVADIDEDDDDLGMWERDEYHFSREEYFVNDEHHSFRTTLGTYLETSQLIHLVLRDIDAIFQENKQEREFKILELKKQIESTNIDRKTVQSHIDYEIDLISEERNEYKRRLTEFGKTCSEIQNLYQERFDWCIQHHKWNGAYYGKGLIQFENGNFDDAMDSISHLIELCKINNEYEFLPAEVYLQKGLIESEIGFYNDAITSLSLAIEKNPQNEEAYFERAVAYFELGKFDESLSDYLAFKQKSSNSSKISPFSLEYASGLMSGLKKGVQDEFGELLPAWAPIMNVCLWTLTHSNTPSAKFITASLTCMAVAGTYLIADQMIGELKELVTNWDSLSDSARGEICGYVIGKYGVDIFACVGSVKMIEAYRELKRANHLLNFELILADETHISLLKTRYQAVEKFKKDQSYIQKVFGRAAYPEMEVRDHLQKMGYSIPKRPEGIPENYIVRFSDKGCGISYHDPANPNYNHVRLMPGKPHSPNELQQGPYIVHTIEGKVLGADGRVLPNKKHPNAHISTEKYVYRSKPKYKE